MNKFEQNVAHWTPECNASTQQCKYVWVDLFVLTERYIGDKRTTITSKSEDKRLLRHLHTLQMLCRYTSINGRMVAMSFFLLWFYWVLCYLTCVCVCVSCMCKISLSLSLFFSLVHWLLLLYAQITIRPHSRFFFLLLLLCAFLIADACYFCSNTPLFLSF